MPAKKAKNQAPVIEVDGESAIILVHKKLYPKDVLFGTAFTFLDRAYIHLDMHGADHFEVTIRPKPGAPAAKGLAGEFCNEMINESVRLKLSKLTEKVRTTIVGRAIGQSMPVETPPAREEDRPPPELPPEVAKILAEEDDSLDFLDDPLGIAVPWEEKYGKKKDRDKEDG